MGGGSRSSSSSSGRQAGRQAGERTNGKSVRNVFGKTVLDVYNVIRLTFIIIIIRLTRIDPVGIRAE